MHHSRYVVHLRMKRGRTGQIAAVERVGYYGFTTIGDVNMKGVEVHIWTLSDLWKLRMRMKSEADRLK